MKKMVLAAAMLAVSGSALAADMAVKAPAPFEPWDFAFGSALMSDYVFRGITQSNHKPSVAAYFEPRYNVTKDVQLYIGAGGASISFPNRAAAEIDIYGGIRPISIQVDSASTLLHFPGRGFRVPTRSVYSTEICQTDFWPPAFPVTS